MNVHGIYLIIVVTFLQSLDKVCNKFIKNHLINSVYFIIDLK